MRVDGAGERILALLSNVISQYTTIISTVIPLRNSEAEYLWN